MAEPSPNTQHERNCLLSNDSYLVAIFRSVFTVGTSQILILKKLTVTLSDLFVRAFTNLLVKRPSETYLLKRLKLRAINGTRQYTIVVSVKTSSVKVSGKLFGLSSTSLRPPISTGIHTLVSNEGKEQRMSQIYMLFRFFLYKWQIP